MGEVFVGVSLRGTENQIDAPTVEVLRLQTFVVGTGEPDPREWARDALVAALEEL
jgi:hypothetical protein